jgi:tRNA-2-methylthio-N6-dimethylallyladenosine synthase
LRQAAAGAGKGDGSLAGAVALSTDIIVGFPGETEADFAATCELVREIGFSQVFTFIYSKRAGTPAAQMLDDTPAELIMERFDRLVAIVQQSAWQQNQLELGRVCQVLFEGVSKRDAQMLAGRNEKNTTVHVPLPPGAVARVFVGRILPVKVELARTWYLRGSFLHEEFLGGESLGGRPLGGEALDGETFYDEALAGKSLSGKSQ